MGAMHRDAGERSPEQLALAGLFAGAAACLLVGVLFPMSAQAPVRLGVVMIAVALVMAGATLALGARLPRRALLAETALAMLCNSLLVAYAHTPAGAIGDAVAYGWIVAYVAVFFPRAALPFAALTAAAFGAGLLAAGIPGLASAWAVISIATITEAAVLAWLSRAVRRNLATDALTGALNRPGLNAVARRRRRDAQVAVAAIDLDAFRAVNSSEGHAGGDRLLAEAAAAWQGALRREDVLARTGGDEFVLLMPGTSETEAQRVLARLRAAHPVAWSSGVADWRPEEPLAACLERADRRLYAAKAARG
jgi:diguanylate cyclase (GGDEF)-like protein